jgi:hypothetical protein
VLFIIGIINACDFVVRISMAVNLPHFIMAGAVMVCMKRHMHRGRGQSTIFFHLFLL